MDKPFFIDYESKICSEFLNTVSNTVWDALGQAQTPQQARIFIGAVEEAPLDGKAYLRASGAWTSAETSLLHNSLGGRSLADAHPLDSITGLTSALAGKAPTVHTHVATEVSFSPSGTISATQVQAAIQELDSETQTALSGLAGDISALEAADAFNVKKTSNTGTALIPAGTEGQRDASPQLGAIRFSSTESGWEGWNGAAWSPIGGGMSQVDAEAAFLQVDGGNQMLAPLVFDSNASAVIRVGATPVAQFPVAAGLPFCKNKLFNGEVTRINQRGFDGNWGSRTPYPNGTIAQNEAAYGYDMWALDPTGNYIMQFIEAGNFRPSTVHTLSGIGVATQQITSPASGNWAITVSSAARNVQVEEGAVATPFEARPISFELAQCQRYYEHGVNAYLAGNIITGSSLGTCAYFKAQKRTTPSLVQTANTSGNLAALNTTLTDTDRILVFAGGAAVGAATLNGTWNASAVI